MKKIILTIVITLTVSTVFAGNLSTLAVEASSDVITMSNINTETNTAVVSLETFSIVYSANKKQATVLIIDNNNETIENTVFKKGSEEFEKISAVLLYKSTEKRMMLASLK